MKRTGISHKKAFELLNQGLDEALRRKSGGQPVPRMREAVLATLEPEERRSLQAHWSVCPDCQADLALTARLRNEALDRWPPGLAPRRSAGALVEAATRPVRQLPWRLTWQFILLTGALLALYWVLDNLRPQPAIPPGLPAQLTITPSPPGLTPSPQLSPTPDPRLEALPQFEITPFIQGRSLDPGGWSPDGRYLAFSQMAPGDPTSDRVFTTYQFFDRQSGQVCTAGEPLLGGFPAPGHATWLADGRLLVAARNEVFLLQPCDPQAEFLTGLFAEAVRFTTLNLGSHSQVVLAGESAYWIYDSETGEARKLADPVPTGAGSDRLFWSPSGLEFAISQPDPSGMGSLISLIDAASGQRIETISLALGSSEFAPWLDWLLDDVLYAYGGPEGGSILLQRGASGWSQTAVFPEIYGLDAPASGSMLAEGAVADPNQAEYHLFLAGQEQGGELVVYHSEDGRVERRPLAEATLLVFPTGKALPIFQLDGTLDGVDFLEVVHVDGPETGPQTLHAAGHRPRGYPQLAVAWLPLSGRVAFGSSQGVSLLDVSTGEPLAFWRFTGVDAPLGYVGLTLDPGGTALFAYAILEGSQEGPHSALYYLPLEP